MTSLLITSRLNSALQLIGRSELIFAFEFHPSLPWNLLDLRLSGAKHAICREKVKSLICPSEADENKLWSFRRTQNRLDVRLDVASGHEEQTYGGCPYFVHCPFCVDLPVVFYPTVTSKEGN